MNPTLQAHAWFAATAAVIGGAGWSAHEGSGPGVVLFIAAAMLLGQRAYEAQRAVSAGQGAS
jgi:hypothetical protein